jgi:tetratricopeptide (TPR) repeat protein
MRSIDRRNKEELRMKAFLALALAMILALPAFVSAEKSLPELKESADAAVAAAAAASGDYAANWGAAKACRLYGDELVVQKPEGWKPLGKAAAKEGMKYGETATKLEPKGIEGWYWYGLCVGTYSDCVSIMTALSEGLKGKTQKAFETAYAIDKNFDNGGPMLSLGRFWQVLPGIAGRDLKKAEQLFNEYIDQYGAGEDPNKDAWYFRGALYKDRGKKAEAKADLEKAAGMGQKDAAKLLAEMK